MKTGILKKVSLGLVLPAMPFVGACNQESSNAPQSLITASQAESLSAIATNPVTSTNAFTGPTTQLPLESAPPPTETAPLPAPAPDAGKTFPPNINPSSPVGEVTKLAQAGVDESVMLSYVNNSASMFNLGSEEIIYLNDIGVPNSVVMAMMQRDQALKQALAENAQAQAAVAQANAAAPTYEVPPQPEPQPAETVAAAQQQPANVTYNYFYDSLSPYGNWINVDGYGSCWQPTVVVINRGWRPYCDRGRWLYTDAGWYWQSDYSWGWAPFHYGRWFYHGRWGWCWYPGYVWGPSWVSWRYSNSYCGWAPLPPAAYYQPGFGFYYQNRSVGFGFNFGIGASWFTFVPWGHFCDSRPGHYRASGTQVTQIYNNTTIINNFVTGNNNTVINRGVPIDQVRRHAGREIREVAIREVRSLPGRSARGERLERGGRTLVVHRPQIPQSPGGVSTTSQHAPPSKVAHQPVGGAGSAALLEVSRTRGQERTITQPRNRVTSPQSSMPTTITSQRTPAPASQRSTTVNQPTPQKPPAGSLIVIGRKDSNPSQSRNLSSERRTTQVQTATPARSSQTWSASQPTTKSKPYISAPRVETPREPSPRSAEPFSYSRSAPQARSYERHQYQRPTLVAPSYSAPTYSAPRSTPTPSRSMPTYSVPRSSPSPAPSYSAPRSAPAPSRSMPTYSAPRSSPSPTPSYTPAPSQSQSRPMSTPSSGRSSSSGRSESSHGRSQ